MADLTVLIRLNKHLLDEKRQALGKIYEELAALERTSRELERGFIQEKEAVDATGDIHYTFPKYAEKVKQQREEIAAQRLVLEQQVEIAKDSMMETFSELKKYEMTQQERARLAAEERAIKEAKNLDEIGLQVFIKNNEE